MRTFEKTPAGKGSAHAGPTDDERMRALLRRLFRRNAWISSLPSARAFFTAFIGRFEDRLREGREKLGLPELGVHDVQRELLFLTNLERPVAIEGRSVKLGDAYAALRKLVFTHSLTQRKCGGSGVADLDHRIAQYVHVIRNARRAVK